MSNLIPRYHVLTRSGFVGEYVPQEQLLPPGTYAAGECPANRQCDLCPLSGKCEKLTGLLTAEQNGELLLPCTFHGSTGAPRPGQASQDGYGEQLLPAGVV